MPRAARCGTQASGGGGRRIRAKVFRAINTSAVSFARLIDLTTRRSQRTTSPAETAKMLTKDEARRIAVNIAKLPVIAAAVALAVFAGGTAGSRLPCSWPDRWSPVFAHVPIARRHLVY